MRPPRYLLNSPHSYDCKRWLRGWLVKKLSHCSQSVISEIVMVMRLHSMAFLFLLQKFAAQYAIDAHIVVSAEAEDSLAQRALILHTRLFVGTTATGILFHILRLNAV